MFDHVGIAVSDRAESERFYRTVLSPLGHRAEPRGRRGLVEWDDFDLGPTDAEHPVTRGLHIGFYAPDRASTSTRSGRPASTPDTATTARPGRGRSTAPTTTAASCCDPDGNSAEAVHSERGTRGAGPDRPPVDPRRRPRRRQALLRHDRAARRASELGDDTPERVQFRRPDASFSLIARAAAAPSTSISRSPRPTTRPCGPSTPPPSPPATRTTAAPGERAGVPPGLLRRVRPRPRRAQRRSGQPQPRLSHGRRHQPPHLRRGPRRAGGRAARARDRGPPRDRRADQDRPRVGRPQGELGVPRRQGRPGAPGDEDPAAARAAPQRRRGASPARRAAPSGSASP